MGRVAVFLAVVRDGAASRSAAVPVMCTARAPGLRPDMGMVGRGRIGRLCSGLPAYSAGKGFYAGRTRGGFGGDDAAVPAVFRAARHRLASLIGTGVPVVGGILAPLCAEIVAQLRDCFLLG